MSPARRLALGVAGLVGLTGLGTLGYRAVEGWPWLDALYMTVITLSTVGFREVQPLSAAGQLLTIGLIVVGVGSALYVLTTLAEFLIAGSLRQIFQRSAMQRRVEELENHVIVCGYGRYGRVVVEELVRELAPRLLIHARGESESSVRRLRQAGADFVTSPYRMGGLRTAASILRPSVVDFIEISAPRRGTEVDLEEVRVGEGSALVGRDLGSLESEAPRLLVVALKRGAETIRLAPAKTARVESGDHLVVIGERDGVDRLAQQAQPRSGTAA